MNIEKLIDKNIECIICLDLIDIEKQNIEIFKDCEHNNNYHVECINNWINECNDNNIIPSCPICRKELELINITNSLNNSVHINHTQFIIHPNIHTVRTNINYTHQFCCVCTMSIFLGLVIISLFNQEMKY